MTESRPEDGGRLILGMYEDAAKIAPASESNHYKGLRIHAFQGLHEAAAEALAGAAPPGGTVLDIACGSGAMCRRLADAGYGVTATDLVADNFRLHGELPFVAANLNLAFSETIGRTFDAITAIEIIEHIENPRHFLRQCARLLTPGGHLILTTPNVDSAFSRAIALRTGVPKWFGEQEYRQDGHITPVPLAVLRRALDEAGFDILSAGSFGKNADGVASWWRMHALAWLLRKLDAATHPQGEILVIVAQRTGDAPALGTP